MYKYEMIKWERIKTFLRMLEKVTDNVKQITYNYSMRRTSMEILYTFSPFFCRPSVSNSCFKVVPKVTWMRTWGRY